MRYDFCDLSKLPIQDSHLHWCMIKGHEAAGDPDSSLCDCPYGLSTDARIRCYRIAWRTAFRRSRQRRGTQPARAFDGAAERRFWEIAA
jgi:hypothetical protein